ncbi:hypothetical protein CEXT_255401 [Caerostris extrusa]|uniref:Uncharacterized protein n=1 Tax=Caerostris extrusa TaxID=172846 RepID=A0AAV4WQD1_CAEEX|nr:hypothetical protein CEXT_255401 [Caerostris extrusa]
MSRHGAQSPDFNEKSKLLRRLFRRQMHLAEFCKLTEPKVRRDIFSYHDSSQKWSAGVLGLPGQAELYWPISGVKPGNNCYPEKEFRTFTLARNTMAPTVLVFNGYAHFLKASFLSESPCSRCGNGTLKAHKLEV